MQGRFAGCVMFAGLILSGACTGGVKQPTAVAGQIDLRKWDWAVRGPVRLQGEWQFYWKRLLVPGKIPDGLHAKLMHVPGQWNKKPPKGISAPALGYGTFRLRVLLPAPGKVPVRALGLKILHADSNYTLFVNGQRVHAVGRVGRNGKESRAMRNPTVIAIEPKTGALDLVVHVSNFVHRNGGLPRALILGPEREVRLLRTQRLMLELFLVGSLLIMGIYHLGLFSLRRKDRSPLYFGVFCLLISLRTTA